MEKEDRGQRSRIRKIITVAGKCLLADVGSLINFAMRHMMGETGGPSAECIVRTKLFFSCSNADF